MKKYNKTSIFIHWVSFILILLMVISGKYYQQIKGTSFGALKVHAVVGLTVALLTIIRVFIHFTQKRPEPLKTNSLLRDKVIVWVQYLFYIVIFILSMTGVLMMLKSGYLEAITTNDLTFKLDEEACQGIHIHRAMVNVFMVLFFAHLAGIFSYILKFRHNIFKRIL